VRIADVTRQQTSRWGFTVMRVHTVFSEGETPCKPVGGYQRFGGIYCFHFQSFVFGEQETYHCIRLAGLKKACDWAKNRTRNFLSWITVNAWADLLTIASPRFSQRSIQTRFGTRLSHSKQWHTGRTWAGKGTDRLLLPRRRWTLNETD
jgi:hypothetical protein